MATNTATAAASRELLLCGRAQRERAFRSTTQFDPAQRRGVVTLFRYRERPAGAGVRHAEHSVSGDGCGRANERSLSVRDRQS